MSGRIRTSSICKTERTHTMFDIITTHTPVGAQSKHFLFIKFQPLYFCQLSFECVGGWVVRKCHVSFVTQGVQLILAYSWARPAILVAGKGREVMFLFLLFLHFHSCFSCFPVPPFHLFCYLFCLLFPFLWETTQNDPQGLTCR